VLFNLDNAAWLPRSGLQILCVQMMIFDCDGVLVDSGPSTS